MDFDNLDFDFMGNEDFGLAKSFTRAPIGTLLPQACTHVNMESTDMQAELKDAFQEASNPNVASADNLSF
jgi:hypothetical protein